MYTIVVGGGLLGIATAYVLSARGKRVTLFESESGLALGASYANGALLTPSMPEPWNSPGVWKTMALSLVYPDSAMKLRLRAVPSLLSWGKRFLCNSSVANHLAATRASFALAEYSLRQTRRLRVKLELSYEAASLGSMKLFRDAGAMALCTQAAQRLATEGLRYRALDAHAAVAVEPALRKVRDHLAGALFYPDDECGDAFRFCQGLARHTRARGARIVTDTVVQRLLLSGERICGVETNKGVALAARVVVAAGCASPRLLAPLGIKLAVQPVKGYSVTIDPGDCDDLPRIPIVDDSMHAAVVPLGRRLRVVGTAEFAGFDTVVDTDRIDNLLRLLAAIYPQVARRIDRERANCWAGLRPMSADGLPFIGEMAIPGLYLNTGHGHLGWTMAVGSAQLLASQMLGEEPGIDCQPYRATR